MKSKLIHVQTIGFHNLKSYHRKINNQLVEDESDGISVISENEIKSGDNVNMSLESETEVKSHDISEKTAKLSNEDDQQQKPFSSELEHENNTTDDDEICTNKLVRSDLVTFSNNSSSSICELHKTDLPSYLLFGACVIAVIAIASAVVISFVNSLKTDIDFMKNKINILEQDNRLLGEKLLMIESRKSSEETLKKSINEGEQKFARPKTKTVYNGESEEAVRIIDKDNLMPDFCYFTEESDLFSEYNKDLCDRIQNQLNMKESKKGSKKNKKSKKKNKNIDDLVAETIDSMNDEIEKIKSKRKSSKNATEKRKNFKNKKNGNWLDERAKSREEFRQNHDDNDEDDINWFLKRKSFD